MGVFTTTLSSGDIFAIFPRVTAGQVAIGALLLCLLILELLDLVHRHA